MHLLHACISITKLLTACPFKPFRIFRIIDVVLLFAIAPVFPVKLIPEIALVVNILLPYEGQD